MQEAEKGAPPQFLSTHPSVSWDKPLRDKSVMRNGVLMMLRAITVWKQSENGS